MIFNLESQLLVLSLDDFKMLFNFLFALIGSIRIKESILQLDFHLSIDCQQISFILFQLI